MIKSKVYICLAISFVLLISTPMIKGIFEPTSLISKLEKRRLNRWPQFNKSESIQSYFSGITNYVKDHFGFRDNLIYLNYLIKYKLNESPVQNVTKGKGDWLFLKTYDALTSNHRKPEDVEKSLIQRAVYIKRTRSFLASKNIPYLFFVAPNKRSVYPEYLPSKYSQIDINKSYRFFLDKINVDGDKFSFDSLQSFNKYKINQYGHDLYYKNDTHWNELGAYFMSEEIIYNLEKNYSNLKIATAPLTFNDKNIRGGDLARYISLDKNLIAIEPSANLPKCTKRSKVKLIRKGFSLSQCNANKLKVLFIGDSFMARIYPFLSRSFGSFYMTKRGLRRHMLNQIISEIEPDIVIEEIVERDLPKPIYN